MKTPRAIYVDITCRCNSRCYYCSHFESESDVAVELPLEEWIDFFKELNKLTVLNVILQGGEPFFRGDIHKIIEGIKQNKMRFTILSNGTLIDNDIRKGDRQEWHSGKGLSAY